VSRDLDPIHDPQGHFRDVRVTVYAGPANLADRRCIQISGGGGRAGDYGEFIAMSVDQWRLVTSAVRAEIGDADPSERAPDQSPTPRIAMVRNLAAKLRDPRAQEINSGVVITYEEIGVALQFIADAVEAVEWQRSSAAMNSLGGTGPLIEVILRSIVNSTDRAYMINRAREALRALGKEG
jgi:hypothetical protein